MIVENIHHVAIIVSDYEKSKDFYVNKLGFEVIREEHRAVQNDIKLEVQLNNCMLEIFGKKDPQPNAATKPTHCGMWHLCFHAPELEKTIAELNALGIATDPIMVNASNGKRIAFFYDPDGLPLELHE